MPTIGVQMLMLKHHIEQVGMYNTLRLLRAIGYRSIEVSQIPVTPANVVEFTRARDELGIEIVALSASPTRAAGVNEPIDTEYDKIVSECRRLDVGHVRIGMMPAAAMRSHEGCDAFCAQIDEQSRRFAGDGIQLHYHNHHIEFAKRDGRYLLDLLRQRAPKVRFQIDVHWVQRGGEHPITPLRSYAGKVDLVHLKDYRIGNLPEEAFVARSAGDHREWAEARCRPRRVRRDRRRQPRLDRHHRRRHRGRSHAPADRTRPAVRKGSDGLPRTSPRQLGRPRLQRLLLTGPGPGFQVPREWSIRPGQALGPRDSP